MSKMIYEVKTDERYDAEKVGIYTSFDDAKIHCDLMNLHNENSEYYSYHIIPVEIDKNIEKLRKGFYSFDFHLKNTDLGIEIAVTECKGHFNESYSYNKTNNTEDVRILARSMKEARDVFENERKRLLEKHIEVLGRYEVHYKEILEFLKSGALQGNFYYANEGSKFMDNSLGGMGVLDDLD